jgi:hypothetical protein
MRGQQPRNIRTARCGSVIGKATRYRDATPLRRIEMEIANAQSFASYTGSAEAQERVKELDRTAGKRPTARLTSVHRARRVIGPLRQQANALLLQPFNALDLRIAHDLDPDRGRVGDIDLHPISADIGRRSKVKPD